MHTRKSNLNRALTRLALLGAILVVGGMGVTAWWGVPFILAGIALLLHCCKDSNDGVLVIGPIAGSELTRRARRQRPWLWRSLYVLIAAAIVFLHFTAYFDDFGISAGSASDRKRLEYINQQIINWFAVCLIGYVSLLSIQLNCSAIAEERLGRRWDVLRATDLRPREILLGLFFARLPTVLDPLLAVAPVLALLPLFGAVSPVMIVSLVVICISLAFGLGAIGMFSSLFAKKPGDAIANTGAILFLYFIITLILQPNPYTSFQYDYLWWLGWGNPYILGLELQSNRGDIETGIFILVWHFSTAMMAFFFAFLFVAIRRLPRAEVYKPVPKHYEMTLGSLYRGLKSRYRGDAVKAPIVKVIVKTAVDRPTVTNEPVVWWERYGVLDAGSAGIVNGITPRLLRNMFIIVFIVSVLSYPLDPIIESLTEWIPWGYGPFRHALRTSVYAATGIVGFISGLCLLPPVFVGAKCIVKERKADTLEPLLLTDLPPEEILFQKWKGISLTGWPIFKVVIAVVMPVALAGLIPIVPAVLILLAVPVVVAFLAMLGVLIGTRVKTALRANVISALLLYLLIYPFGLLPSILHHYAELRAEVVAPLGIPLAIFSAWTPHPRHNPQTKALAVLFWCLGMLLYTGLTRVLYQWACYRFRDVRGQSRT